MASSSKNVLSIQGSDNGTILDNSRDESCKEVENESFTLMNEFRSLYADKLKAIEENCEDPTEPKIRTLQEWINDLTEQNLVLIKTVEELEKEALNRVNTFNNLALEAKEVTHKDSREEALEKRLSVTLQNRVSDLQIALNKNDFTLEKCKTEIKDLSRQLEEKNKEVDSLRCSGERLVELQNKIQELENDLQSKCEEITCLREKNQQLSLETNGALRRSEELKCKVNNLQSEINERDSQLQQKCASIQNNREKTAAEERQCLMREELNRLKAAEECLKSRICELEMTLEQSKKELMELKYENEQKAALLKSQRLKNEELKKDNQDLSINICQNENKIHEYACKEIAAQQVLDKLHKEIGLAQKRIASQEDYIIRLEEELESLKCTSNADVAREKTEQMEGIIKNMQMELEKKDCQLNQLTKGATYTNTTPERIPGKTQSESAVGAILTNKSLDDSSNQMSLPDTFQESKSYIQSITELENEFDETNSEIWRTWRSLKLWSESSGDVYSSNFEDIIKSTEEDNEALAKLATDLGKVLDEKEENESICNLDYLEGNLIELGRYLTKVNMMSHSSSSSDLEKHDSEKYDELGSLSKKVSMVISDSLSLVYEIKRKNVSQITPSVKVCLQDLVVSFSKILGHKNAFFEKLISLQRQQSEFSHTLIGRINEIDAGLSAYNGSANNLKNEIRKLFSVVLTKDSQIQKQINEITNLKILLSSMSKSDENNSDEISNLRRVVSNKDLQLIEKEELIHNLRTLNYTLQRTKVSRSSPSICNAGDFVEDIDDKMVQLEDTVKSIKGNVSSILMYLVRTQDKMSEFEDDSRNLVKNLAHIHQEIMSFKDVITTNMIGQGDIYNVNGLDEQLTEVAVKIEELLNAVEIFLCDSEKPDLNSLSESLRSKVMKLSYVAEYIKKSAVNEKSFLKSLTDENDSMKRKIRSLEEALAKEKSLSAKDSGRDEVIESLQENLRKACSDLDAIREEYEKLKVKKEEVEAKNQKVMEELQSKICGLQEASSQTRPTDTSLEGSFIHLQEIIEKQIEKIDHLEKLDIVLKNTIVKKEEDLNINKKEMSSLRLENTNLQKKINDAQHLIMVLKQNFEDKKEENNDLKHQLEKLGNLTELQNSEVDRLHEELLMHTVKFDQMKVTEALIQEKYNQQSLELEALTQEKDNLENKVVLLKEDLMKKTEEIIHRQAVSEIQKENLAKYMEENQALKIQHDQDEKLRVKLEYDLEVLKEELEVVSGRERQIAAEIVEKKQAIYQLNLMKLKQESYIRDLETVLNERSKHQDTPDEKGDRDKGLIEEQQHMIEILTVRLNQMSEYIAERDEIIKLIENQLKTSTELMVEENEPQERSWSNPAVSKQTMSHSDAILSYKLKLQQAMHQNWRLVTIVNKLQQTFAAHVLESNIPQEG